MNSERSETLGAHTELLAVHGADALTQSLALKQI